MTPHADEYGLEHVGGQEMPVYTTCPQCGEAMGIDHIELKHTNQLVRKATCLNGKCAVRIYTRTALAKPEPLMSATGNMKLFCTNCAEQTKKLWLHKRGLVCERCLSVK